jgi:MFS family permease
VTTAGGAPTAPDRPGPPTRLFTPAFVALFVAALAFFIAGGLVLPVATRFAAGPLGADAAGVGIGIGAFAIASLLVRPAVGWASDRFGRRPLLLLGGIVTTVALVAHLAADTLLLFVVVRSAFGIGEALFFVAAVAAISDLAPDDRRGEAINVGSLAVYLGLAIGPFFGEIGLDAFGFDGAWLVGAAAAVVATVCCLFVPETAPSVLAAARDGVRPPRGRFFHPAGVLPGLLILTGAWGMAGFLAFIPLHATAVGLDGAGLPLAMYALIVVGLRIVFVKAPDQIGAARLSGAALVVSAIGLALIAVAPGIVGLLVATAVFAGGIAFMFPALLAVAVARVGEAERGSVVGTSSLFLDLSFGLAPAALGVVVDASGFTAAFLSAAVVAAIGAAVIAVRRRSLAAPGPRPAATPAPPRLPA